MDRPGLNPVKHDVVPELIYSLKKKFIYVKRSFQERGKDFKIRNL